MDRPLLRRDDVLAVLVVAIVLGLRHASDPDHLAAVTTLVANGDRNPRRLGLSWGAGHALSLVVLGVPIVLWKAFLPPRVEQSAEVAIGLVIAALALWLLVRWRRGAFAHDHSHLRVPPTRTTRRAFAIGLLHGVGGSGGVGVLLLASIRSHAVALVALVLFALFTAVSMAVLSSGFAQALARPRLQRSLARVVPAFGVVGVCFGLWYAAGAVALAPYWL